VNWQQVEAFYTRCEPRATPICNIVSGPAAAANRHIKRFTTLAGILRRLPRTPRSDPAISWHHIHLFTTTMTDWRYSQLGFCVRCGFASIEAAPRSRVFGGGGCCCCCCWPPSLLRATENSIVRSGTEKQCAGWEVLTSVSLSYCTRVFGIRLRHVICYTLDSWQRHAAAECGSDAAATKMQSAMLILVPPVLDAEKCPPGEDGI
jgi:hypothetical protein